MRLHAVHPVEDAGVYCLVLRLPQPRRITVGRLGCRRLAAGWYAYVGSAKRNLAARLGWHLRREKRFRWHIDYLRAVARVEHIWVWAWTDAGECRTNGWIQGLPGAAVPWNGFGSSDCGCRSHLTVFKRRFALAHGPAPRTLVVASGRSGRPPDWDLTPASKGRILSPRCSGAR